MTNVAQPVRSLFDVAALDNSGVTLPPGEDLRVTRPFTTPDGTLARAVRTSRDTVIVKFLQPDAFVREMTITGLSDVADGDGVPPDVVMFGWVDFGKRLGKALLGVLVDAATGGTVSGGNNGGNSSGGTTIQCNGLSVTVSGNNNTFEAGSININCQKPQ